MSLDQNTEERILDAANAVFLEKGMSGTRMQDIADRAGINKALLHYYFRTKDKLFLLIFRQSLRQFLPRIQDLIGEDGDLRAFIRTFVTNYMDLLAARPYLASFILHEIRQHPDLLWTMLQEASPGPFPYDGFVRMVRKANETGRIRPVDPRQLWTHMMALCVFPFMAQPLLTLVFHTDPQGYGAFLDERREEVILLLHSRLNP